VRQALRSFGDLNAAVERSFILRFSELTEESPTRPRDAVLRAFDMALSAFFLLVTLL